jgi:aminopeptidase YwaD
VLLYIAGVALLWLELFWLAALLATAGLILMIGQFFFYRELLDPFFPRQTGRNVLASAGAGRRGTRPVDHQRPPRQRAHLQLPGHQPALYPWRVTGGIAIYVLFLLDLLASGPLDSGQRRGAGLVNRGRGAVEPAAAVGGPAVVVRLGQVHARRGRQPGLDGRGLGGPAPSGPAEGSRPRPAASAGDRGQLGRGGGRAARRARLGQGPRPGDDRLALPTWNLNLECLYDAHELFLLTSDVNGTVQLSPELAGQCQQLLAARGRDVPAKPIAFLTGGTDAGELARGGAQATTLIGMPWGNTQRSSVYHTPATCSLRSARKPSLPRLGWRLIWRVNWTMGWGCDYRDATADGEQRLYHEGAKGTKVAKREGREGESRATGSPCRCGPTKDPHENKCHRFHACLSMQDDTLIS